MATPTVDDKAVLQLALADIKIVFTDLDGTLYPGAHEVEPAAEKRGLMANMKQVGILEARGLPVVPATGNNVGFAQQKMVDPATGRKLRDLSTAPGIYCNGALVKGVGGKEVDVRSLEGFLPEFTSRWMREGTPSPGHKCIAGLGKQRVYFLNDPRLSAAGRTIAQDFVTLMMIPPQDYEWLEPAEFERAGTEILSLLLLLPKTEGTDSAELLQVQQWLHANDLLHFEDALAKQSNGEGTSVVCKHVHVPGLGPEIDISPSGVNKGSAIKVLLQDAEQHLGVRCAGSHQIAVFGDAGNDIELFGMKRDGTGAGLLPLGLDFRPSVRVAMPWANDNLLLKDANVIAPCSHVLSQIVAVQDNDPRRLVEIWPANDACDDAEIYSSWPVWTCPALPDKRGQFQESKWWESRPGVSEERCFITAGKAVLEFPEAADVLPVIIHENQWVIFRKGCSCVWKVQESIAKRYQYFKRDAAAGADESGEGSDFSAL